MHLNGSDNEQIQFKNDKSELRRGINCLISERNQFPDSREVEKFNLERSKILSKTSYRYR